MKLHGIKIELANAKEMEGLVKKSINYCDQVNTEVQKVAQDIANWSFTLKTSLADLEKVKKQALTAQVLAERAKQKDQANLFRKIGDKATAGINQYSKLAKSIGSFKNAL